jgi:hypothetical protein
MPEDKSILFEDAAATNSEEISESDESDENNETDESNEEETQEEETQGEIDSDSNSDSEKSEEEQDEEESETLIFEGVAYEHDVKTDEIYNEEYEVVGTWNRETKLIIWDEEGPYEELHNKIKKKVEPIKDESKKVEPIKEESKKVEPIKEEPIKEEPIKEEPIKEEDTEDEHIEEESIKEEAEKKDENKKEETKKKDENKKEETKKKEPIQEEKKPIRIYSRKQLEAHTNNELKRIVTMIGLTPRKLKTRRGQAKVELINKILTCQSGGFDNEYISYQKDHSATKYNRGWGFTFIH